MIYLACPLGNLSKNKVAFLFFLLPSILLFFPFAGGHKANAAGIEQAHPLSIIYTPKGRAPLATAYCIRGVTYLLFNKFVGFDIGQPYAAVPLLDPQGRPVPCSMSEETEQSGGGS